MSTITWPTTGRLSTGVAWDEGIESDVQINIARAGNVTTRELPGSRWLATIALLDESVQNRVSRQQGEAIFAKLRGGANKLAMFNPAKPAPAGTLRGSPAVRIAGAVGDGTLALKDCDGTVLRGDLLAFAGQRVLITADASPSSGNMTITFEPPLRAAVGVDTAVLWDKPTSLFIPKDPRIIFPYRGNAYPGFAVELLEAWE